MIFELFLLIPFGGAAFLGLRQYLDYRAMKARGMEVPAALFSNKPPGQIKAYDWSQRQLENLDPRRAEAIAIGEEELAAPSTKAWDKAYHFALLAQGAPMIETGNAVFDPRTGRTQHDYFLEDCDCISCEVSQKAMRMLDSGHRKG